MIENQKIFRDVYNLDEVYSKPVLIKQVPVIYPQEAQDQRLSGKVVVNVLVDEKGFVVEVDLFKALNDVIDLQNDGDDFQEVSLVKKSGQLTSLDEAALQAARLSRFEPAFHNGRPVKTYFILSFTFVSK